VEGGARVLGGGRGLPVREGGLPEPESPEGKFSRLGPSFSSAISI
jgi:hypothetical protein